MYDSYTSTVGQYGTYPHGSHIIDRVGVYVSKVPTMAAGIAPRNKTGLRSDVYS